MKGVSPLTDPALFTSFAFGPPGAMMRQILEWIEKLVYARRCPRREIAGSIASSPKSASRCGSADRPAEPETSILHSPDSWSVFQYVGPVFQKTISRPSSVQTGA